MSTKRFTKNRRQVFSHCVRHGLDIDVQNGLAITPSQMYDMAQKGIPVAAQNLGIMYDEGYSELDFTPPLEYRRGIDIADAFEARMDAKAKLRKQRDAGKFNVKSEGA